MSVLPVGFGSSGGLSITNSVRLRAAASAYFSRTFGTPTTQNTFMFSCWIKRGGLGVGRSVFSTSTGTDDFYFNSSDQLVIWRGSTVATSTAVSRDPTAHLHFVIKADGSTVKCYINNAEVCSYTGTMTAINTATAHHIGYDGTYYFDGYLSDVYFVDGQALTPSSFGETNSDGVWVPKAYTGTYGTNGFHLDFKDAAVTAGSNAGLGKDVSGNGNYWTTNLISVSPGVTYDSMVDTPTNNYATLNPLQPCGTITATNGNLTSTVATQEYGQVGSIVMKAVGGKYYWEGTPNATTSNSAGLEMGVATANVGLAVAAAYSNADVWAFLSFLDHQFYRATTGTAHFGSTITTTDRVQIAVDNTGGTNALVWVGVNDVWYDSGAGTTTGNPSAGTNPTFTISSRDLVPFFGGYQNAQHINFGQRPFTYTPPTGFKALCTANLP